MDMMNVLSALLLLGVLGGVFGLVLAVASKVFEVHADPRVTQIAGILPGANCGGCGFAGCNACATNIVAGNAPVNACPVCAGDQVSRIAAIMGVEVTTAERRVASVRCAGGERAAKKFRYVGIQDCLAALKVGGNGPLDCGFGCLGFGNCVRACPFGAMYINKNGVAQVNRELCTNCLKCAEVCPRDLIVSVPYASDILVRCNNKDKGAVAKNYCTVSCIGCKLCEKNCEQGAIKVVENRAMIDYKLCTSCGVCVAKCPRKLIVDLHADGRVAPVVVKGA